MKKRAKLTPFAKIVILVVIVLIARYAYLHKDEIASGEFFNFLDSTEVELDTNSVVPEIIDSAIIRKDTLIQDTVVLQAKVTDTVSIIIEKLNDVLSINTNKKSINLLLSDSVLISDTIFFEIPNENKVIGRIIIK